MSFYSPAQMQWLQYAIKVDPSLLPMLQNAASNVQPIDTGRVAQSAATARDTYLRNNTAPLVGAAAISGGTTDNSFSASKQAAIAAQGAAQAQSVYNDTYTNQLLQEENLQAHQQKMADDNWNSFMNDQAPQIAKNAAKNPTMYANIGMSNPNAYLYSDSYKSMSPMTRMARIGSGAADAFGQAAPALGNLVNQFRGTGNNTGPGSVMAGPGSYGPAFGFGQGGPQSVANTAQANGWHF